MKKTLLGAALVIVAAPFLAASAQDLPKLSDFLSKCSRDSSGCRSKVKDFVTASVSQKSICLPKDVSIYDAVTETLRWVKASDTHAQSLNDAPFDDGLYEATTKLYPCAPPEPAPPAEPAAPPAQ